jgi:hypothetical protein
LDVKKIFEKIIQNTIQSVGMCGKNGFLVYEYDIPCKECKYFVSGE